MARRAILAAALLLAACAPPQRQLAGPSDGLAIVDNGTGCQYVRTPDGALSVRYDYYGRPMCPGINAKGKWLAR